MRGMGLCLLSGRLSPERQGFDSKHCRKRICKLSSSEAAGAAPCPRRQRCASREHTLLSHRNTAAWVMAGPGEQEGAWLHWPHTGQAQPQACPTDRVPVSSLAPGGRGSRSEFRCGSVRPSPVTPFLCRAGAGRGPSPRSWRCRQGGAGRAMQAGQCRQGGQAGWGRQGHAGRAVQAGQGKQGSAGRAMQAGQHRQDGAGRAAHAGPGRSVPKPQAGAAMAPCWSSPSCVAHRDFSKGPAYPQAAWAPVRSPSGGDTAWSEGVPQHPPRLCPTQWQLLGDGLRGSSGMGVPHGRGSHSTARCGGCGLPRPAAPAGPRGRGHCFPRPLPRSPPALRSMAARGRCRPAEP